MNRVVSRKKIGMAANGRVQMRQLVRWSRFICKSGFLNVRIERVLCQFWMNFGRVWSLLSLALSSDRAGLANGGGEGMYFFVLFPRVADVRKHEAGGTDAQALGLV